jgi:hypothetical protein
MLCLATLLRQNACVFFWHLYVNHNNYRTKKFLYYLT